VQPKELFIHISRFSRPIALEITMSDKVKLTVYPLDQLSHPLDKPLYPRLMRDVIILNPIEKFRETPEGIGFYSGEDGGWEMGHVEEFGIGVYERYQS